MDRTQNLIAGIEGDVNSDVNAPTRDVTLITFPERENSRDTYLTCGSTVDTGVTNIDWLRNTHHEIDLDQLKSISTWTSHRRLAVTNIDLDQLKSMEKKEKRSYLKKLGEKLGFASSPRGSEPKKDKLGLFVAGLFGVNDLEEESE